MTRAKRLSVTTETPRTRWRKLGVGVGDTRFVRVDIDGHTVADFEVSEIADGTVGVHATIYERGSIRTKWKRRARTGAEAYPGHAATTFSLQVKP